MKHVERNRAIYDERQAGGVTLRELGEKYGLSKDRIRQIVAKQHRLLNPPEKLRWCHDLSIRGQMVLRNMGFTSKQEVRDAMPIDFLDSPNVGRKTDAEIRAWLLEPDT